MKYGKAQRQRLLLCRKKWFVGILRKHSLTEKHTELSGGRGMDQERWTRALVVVSEWRNRQGKQVENWLVRGANCGHLALDLDD